MIIDMPTKASIEGIVQKTQRQLEEIFYKELNAIRATLLLIQEEISCLKQQLSSKE